MAKPMGILDWFRSGEGGGSGNERDPDREVTPGGSVVYHYGRETNRPRFGAVEEDTSGYSALRETAYRALFGEPSAVYHEVVPLLPHVDIFVFAPQPGVREFTTLVTGGMSDLPMTVPEPVGREGRRSELVLYCQESKPEYASMLRFLAHFPHDNRTWLGHGHTMPNGQPPEPLFLNSELDTFLMLVPPFEEDASLRDSLEIGGDPVNLTWVVPITSAECQWKLENGMVSLWEQFARVGLPVILDENRASVV